MRAFKTGDTFRMQPRVIEREEHGEPYQDVKYEDEPPHIVRSIGNAVGRPAFRNTNRPKANYLRKKNRIARRLGFQDAAHLAIFKTLMTAKAVKQAESQP